MRQPDRDKVSQLKDLGAYEGIAQAAAFADPIRLEMVEALAQSARSVESLAEICGLPQKNISYHLQRLRAGGIVKRIPLDLPVVAYCRGPYCKMAGKAVELLKDAGYKATRFADGLVEWKGAGLELVESDDHFTR